MFTDLGRVIRSEVVLHLFHAELAPEEAQQQLAQQSPGGNGNIHYEHETSAGADVIDAALGGGGVPAVGAGVPRRRPSTRASTTSSAATTRAGAAAARSSRSATARSARAFLTYADIGI